MIYLLRVFHCEMTMKQIFRCFDYGSYAPWSIWESWNHTVYLVSVCTVYILIHRGLYTYTILYTCITLFTHINTIYIYIYIYIHNSSHILCMIYPLCIYVYSTLYIYIYTYTIHTSSVSILRRSDSTSIIVLVTTKWAGSNQQRMDLPALVIPGQGQYWPDCIDYCASICGSSG